MSSNVIHDDSAPYEMSCMEILGGIEATSRVVKCPGLDVWVSSRPYRDEPTGGDVHYLSLCGGGVITRVLLGDVSGHGENVREFAEELRRLVKRHIIRKSQRRFMRDLNQSFLQYADLRRFATVVVMTYLSHRRTIEMCIAGHPRPLHYSRASDRWSFLGEGLVANDPARVGVTNMPIGIDDRVAFDTFLFALDPGDVLLLYTDGLTETRSREGTMLGEQGLLAIVRSFDLSTMNHSEIGPRLMERAAAFRGDAGRDDDETLMVLHHNGMGPKSAGLGERIEAVVKLLRFRDF